MTTAKKVLVVEDCSDVLELLQKGLALLGWNVALARSGREALNKLASDSPSVILLDMRTPEMNGFELVRILKAHPVYGKIPILAAGGYYGHITREQCLAAGFTDLIAKPFAFSELETHLAELLSAGKPKTIDAL
jgi:two-component system alkaline phosphatase synthesis response regulator PhoP